MPRFTILAWEPSAKVPLDLSPLQLPVHCAEMDSFTVLKILDDFMYEASDVLVGLIFDGATGHQTARRLLFGTPTSQDLKLAKNMRFFGQLSYCELPDHPLPRLPIQFAMFRSECYIPLPAVCVWPEMANFSVCVFMYVAICCNFHQLSEERLSFLILFDPQGHAAKNTGGQLTSASRTLMMGDFWVDYAGALLHGLPGVAYIKKDRQSDQLHALLVSPDFLVTSLEEENLLMRSIPWHCRGALLFSLSTGLAYGPAIHGSMTQTERVENALTGFLLWDLWSILSARKESRTEERVGSFSMSHIPVANIQNVCLSTVVLLLGKPEACN